MGVVGWILGFTLDIGVVTSALVGLIVTLILLWVMKYRKYKLPPGPPGYPLIGNLLGMRGKEIHRLFTDWSKEYGPVFKVYLGPQLNIVLNNTEVVLEALVKRQADFAGRPTSVTIDMLSDGGRSIVFGEGRIWKLHRKLSTKAIRHFMKGSCLDKNVHQNMQSFSDLMKSNAGPIDPTPYIISVITNIICGVCFGHGYGADDGTFKKIITLFETENDGSSGKSGFFLEDLIPFLHHCPTKGFKTLKKDTEWFQNLIEVELEQHRKTIDSEHIRDLTDALLVAQTQEDLEDDKEAFSQITDRHIVQTVADIFLAGIDTTRLTILFALKYMAAYPDTQQKIYDEITRVVGTDKLPEIADKERLPYTDAVIHEILRIHPVGPISVPHKTTCDTSVGGYDVPKDTQVFVNLWALHHDAEKWEKVEKFCPERFLNENGTMAPKPESWLPFSAGRRVCLGETVVKPELVLLLACVVQRFKMKFPDGVNPDMGDKYVLLALYPNPYKIIFEER